jgi:hypothetical protein
VSFGKFLIIFNSVIDNLFVFKDKLVKGAGEDAGHR